MSRNLTVAVVGLGIVALVYYATSEPQPSPAPPINAPPVHYEPSVQYVSPPAALPQGISPFVPPPVVVPPPVPPAAVPQVPPAAPPQAPPATAAAPPPARVIGAVYPSDYFDFVSDVIDRTFGNEFAALIYDPTVIGKVAANPESFVWRIPHPAGGPHLPGHEVGQPVSAATLGPLETFEGQLLFAKRAMSSFIGRIHRDAELARLYSGVRSNPYHVASVEQSIRALLMGVFRQMQLQIQASLFTSQAVGKSHRSVLRELAKGRAEPDAVWFFFGELKHDTSVEAAQALFNDGGAKWRTARLRAPLASTVSPTTFDYDEFADFGTHRNLNFMRPLVACRDTTRTCEDPEGCRFLCNGAYFLHASNADFRKMGVTTADTGDAPTYHRILGGGSMNDYRWEDSLLRYFAYDKPGRPGVTNGIYTMTVFDCTINFNIPDMYRKVDFGFGYAKLCIGSRNDGRFVTYQEVKKRVLASEKSGYAPPTADDIIRLPKAAGAVVPAVTAGGLLDDISIFKIDVEGFEVDLLPDWALDEYSALRSNTDLLRRLSSDSRALIDFAVDAAAAPTVSLFQLELHNHGNDARSLQNWFHQRWLLTFLGFSQVTMEYNFLSVHGCCFEAIYPHYRFFVKSELWYAAKNPPKLNTV